MRYLKRLEVTNNFFTYKGESVFVGNKSKFLIAVPEENISACQGLLQQLLDTKVDDTKFRDFLDIEFKSMETMLNL